MKQYIITEGTRDSIAIRLELDGRHADARLLRSLPELPGANDVVPTKMVTCPGCSGTGKDGSYSDGTACHFCKGAGKLLQLDAAKMRPSPSSAEPETAFISFLDELARATGVLPDYADLTNNGNIIRHFAKLTNPAPAEPETCAVELAWQCCNITGDGLYQYLDTACGGNASDRDEWKFCPICGKPIKPGRE